MTNRIVQAASLLGQVKLDQYPSAQIARAAVEFLDAYREEVAAGLVEELRDRQGGGLPKGVVVKPCAACRGSGES